MLAFLLAFAVLLVAALLAFGLGAILPLHGIAYIVFVAVLLLVGIAAAATILILHYRAKKQAAEAGEPSAENSTSDLDLLLNDANRKLRSSQQGAKTLDGLPLLYLLGDSGTAKTTQVIRSGLDPELLAGSAPREGEVVSTPLVNVWFTRQAAIIEAGTAVRGSRSLLTRLIDRTRPRAYRSAFGSGAAARMAVVCVSAEQLLIADGGTSLLASARATGAQLREMSRLLGTPLPVYVLITKLDRVAHFEEYVRNLSEDEVRQILGATVAKTTASAGVYADKAASELNAVLDGLYYTLGEFRVEMLARETEPRHVPGVYEFPREFGKLRKNLGQYLVELCKPSQLSVNPYLRGFYFTGIRAQVIERLSGPPPVAAQRIAQPEGATQYLNISLGKLPGSVQPAPQSVMVSSRVPQWTFLPRLFPEVILGDTSALSATRQTAPARLFRRILFGTFALIFSVYLILLLVSYLNNAGMENRILEAAQTLPTPGANGVAVPSLANLQALDSLRQTILQLDGYEREGAPWSYRFGLYQGDKLRARARVIYFDRFRPLLLNQTQANFLAFLKALPDSPAASDDTSSYIAAYNPLKAYLITTRNPEKSVPRFLTPVFLQYWMGARPVDIDQKQLAEKQIDFYANELIQRNPYSINPDSLVVNHARGYLSNFLAQTRIYQDMLNAADKTGPSLEFNKLYPGSAASVVDAHLVRGAFTRAGFAFMQGAIQHPESYLQGEPWVLGDQSRTSLDTGSVSKDLATKYSADFIKEWHGFLTDAHVISCGNLREAPTRLNALSGPDSPMLALFYTVSHNTAVADPAIKAAFQPAQVLVDPEKPDHFIGAGNTNYVNALLALAGAVSQVAQNPAAPQDPTAFAPIVSAASAADIATRQTAQAFSIDAQNHTENTVLALLQAPIQCASKLPPPAGAPANGAGQKMCGAMTPLFGKFPFSPSSSTQASLDEVNAVFTPDSGVLWSIYNANLKTLLVPQGAQYVPAPAAPVTVNPAFAQSFSRLARISTGLYPAGAKSPSFTFTLRSVPSKGVQSATLVVDGQRIPSGSFIQQFKWSAADAHQASLVYDSNEVLPFQGTWSLFQLVHLAQITRIDGGLRLNFPIETVVAGHKTDQPGAPAKVVSFEISGPGAEILAPEYFGGLRCALPVVK